MNIEYTKKYCHLFYKYHVYFNSYGEFPISLDSQVMLYNFVLTQATFFILKSLHCLAEESSLSQINSLGWIQDCHLMWGNVSFKSVLVAILIHTFTAGKRFNFPRKTKTSVSDCTTQLKKRHMGRSVWTITSHE